MCTSATRPRIDKRTPGVFANIEIPLLSSHKKTRPEKIQFANLGLGGGGGDDDVPRQRSLVSTSGHWERLCQPQKPPPMSSHPKQHGQKK